MIDLAAKALLKLAADCRDSEGVTLPKERALKIATAIDNVLVRLETAEATPASSPASGDIDLIRNLVIPMVRERSREPGDAWHQAEHALAALSQSTSGRVGE